MPSLAFLEYVLANMWLVKYILQREVFLEYKVPERSDQRLALAYAGGTDKNMGYSNNTSLSAFFSQCISQLILLSVDLSYYCSPHLIKDLNSWRILAYKIFSCSNICMASKEYKLIYRG